MRRVTLLFALGLLVGCGSFFKDFDRDEDARQELLQQIPVGALSRSEVHAREDGAEPSNAWQRPPEGWSDDEYGYNAWCRRSESRTGTQVARAERYLHPRGVFGLSYWWYFYDADDRLVDVDWQWTSD